MLALEQELNALVERRGAMFRAAPSEAVMLEQWERSRQEYRERQRIERLEAWMVWRESQVRGFDRLSTEHREKAALLAEQLMELEFGDSIWIAGKPVRLSGVKKRKRVPSPFPLPR